LANQIPSRQTQQNESLPSTSAPRRIEEIEIYRKRIARWTRS
jgi:hypothetical protein